ncbi:aconitate hydratase AcnA [Aquabacterium sp. J223]|uniref:aconitate hydratase AcnA n=1 Tax=Aquabacterium sp. J223 TaxID=2898431 RepID=UPI0021ADE1C3|nr:aconitate hydratase AcnA [Aquabacterium sp. J223]UUX94655.1 aconitate hydratase AcnA [Aquabacterium sp. J223]
MPAPHAFADTLQRFTTASGAGGQFYSLPALAQSLPGVRRLPVSLRLVLESVLRNCDGKKVTAEHVKALANWQPKSPRTEEIPFIVARVVLQDFTGVPLLADLAAMRNVAADMQRNPKTIEPLVPVDLVVDHSVMIDHYRGKDSLDLNMKLEFSRNLERYQFMKWGMQAFDTFRVVPPGFGIVHQVNLEYLARGVHKTADGVHYPDTLVGTDSHTTMINGIGVVGWGVGGIEAEAGMLGQPVYFLTPDVVGFELTGALREGVTATDLVLTVTEILRKEKVVGKFVEFFGEGTASIGVPDRATIGNMAPEYGATMGFFPVDEKTIAYFRGTGRTDAEIEAFEAYFKAQGLFGVPKSGDIDYSQVVTLDLSTVVPSVAGPKRPQDRIPLDQLSASFDKLFSLPVDSNGFGQPPAKLKDEYPAANGVQLHHGDVLIAAITSCTNTSNPSVLLAAGLLAKKAVEAGLTVSPHIKTSLAPGSRVVTDYYTKTGLLPYLEQLGFAVAAYGCTTCIGNAGDLVPEFNETIAQHELVCAAVLSGNRNFEARIHPNIKANFLASPPLVVAYAIAGSVRRDLMTEPLGTGKNGQPVFLKDIWPTSQEVHDLLKYALDPEGYRSNYDRVTKDPGELWSRIKGVAGQVYDWPTSTYIARPPFFDGFTMQPQAQEKGVKGARIMALFGDSITTDHISPAGSIKEASPAGQYLKSHGVMKADFNSYGSRRGNHEVMVRGTFANVRIKNLMILPREDGSRVEGGLTIYQHEGAGDGPTGGATAAPRKGEQVFIYDAAMAYMKAGVPTVVFAGEEYGTGSSRDWAAKGTQLLGIKAVVARSFERIHRSNLVGMGVLPLQFRGTDSWNTLKLWGDESIDIVIDGDIRPQGEARLVVHRADGSTTELPLTVRIDTPIEVDYYQHGGILPFVLRQLLAA